MHLACLAEMLDPSQQFADDPYIFCARCFTEAYDEVTAFRVLDPNRHALLLNTEASWGTSDNQDVFFNYVLPAIASQPDVHHLDKPFVPPTPAGPSPFAAARTRRATASAPTPPVLQGGPRPLPHTPVGAGPAPELELPVPLGVVPGGRMPVAEDQAALLMDTAREDPATVELRQAVEHLQLQLQQLRDGGGEGLSRSHSGYQVDPTGVDLGYKSGEIGAPNHRLLAENALYPGVGAITKPQKREIAAMINTESITDKQGCGYWPESGSETSQVVIGGEVLEVRKQGKGIPEQLVVQHYLAKMITRWLSIRECKRDVYAPDRTESFFFRQSATLILARLEFLKETLYHLTNFGYSWPGVWRYLLLI